MILSHHVKIAKHNNISRNYRLEYNLKQELRETLKRHIAKGFKVLLAIGDGAERKIYNITRNKKFIYLTDEPFTITPALEDNEMLLEKRYLKELKSKDPKIEFAMIYYPFGRNYI